MIFGVTRTTVEDEGGKFAAAVNLFEAAEYAEDAGDFDEAESARNRAMGLLGMLAVQTGESPVRLRLKAERDALRRYLENC